MSSIRSSRITGIPAFPRPVSELQLVLGQVSSKKTTQRKPGSQLTRSIQSEKQEYRTLSSRMGELAFHPKTTRSRVNEYLRHTSPRVSSEDEVEETESSEVFLTLPLMLSIDSAYHQECFDNVPIFLRTLVLDGFLNTSFIKTIAQQSDQHTLLTMTANMSDEVTFYHNLQESRTVAEAECVLESLLPIQKARIWKKTELQDLFISETERRVLSPKESIIGAVFGEREGIFLEDPGHHPRFSVDVDIPAFGGLGSLGLLPITRSNDEVCGALQASGFFDPETEEQCGFSQYHMEVLKLACLIVQRKFFHERKSLSIPKESLSSLTAADPKKQKEVAKLAVTFLADTLNCEVCQLFEYDDRLRTLTPVGEEEPIERDELSVAYQCGFFSKKINIPHNYGKNVKSPQDNKLTNRSILSMSFFVSHVHYVIVARGKKRELAFGVDDEDALTEIGAFILSYIAKCRAALDADRRLKNKILKKTLYTAITKAIGMFANKGADPWVCLKAASQQFFGVEEILVARFSGRYMTYVEQNTDCPFENCVAGCAFNYRRVVHHGGDHQPSPEEALIVINEELYRTLGVKYYQSLAFPLKIDGRVVGAVEVVNPQVMTVSKEAQEMFSALISILFKFQPH